jgi:hypothetical protein
MRIKEIMERVDAAYDPEAGVFRNLGRASLNRFVRGQLGIDAYDDEQEAEKRKERAAKQAAQQAAQAIDQAEVPAGAATPQTAATNTQSVAPNFAQTTAGRTTVNAPTATVPAIRPYVPQVSTVTSTAPAQTPAVNPAKPPQVYTFDGRALNPNNPNDAKIIKQLQAAGVTSAKVGIPRTK